VHARPLPPVVAFLSPCGWGNLGDAAIVDSLVHAVRRRQPGVRIVGFTLNPADTAARHGVEAFTCAAASLPFYPVQEPAGEGGPGPGGIPAAATREDARRAAGLRALLRRLPIHGALRTWLLAPLRAWREPGHLRLSRARLAGASAMVVAGGGQLDATWGGPLGHPYALWRWSRLARSVGARFVVASVGTGKLGRAARLFIRGALRRADYRSYRDARSRELLGAPGITAADPVVPDLAYAVPVEPSPPPRGPRLVVGVSPMNFRHPHHWPERHLDDYRRHVASFAALSAELLRRGHEVVLFTTDRDTVATGDVVAALGSLPEEQRRRLRVAANDTVPGLFAILAGVDVVVAARLHGVLLAHVARRPVLAVAHERKVRTLMEDAGQARYCLGIDGFDPAAACARLEELVASREELEARIAAHVAECRGRVEAQYDALFGAPATASAPSPRTGGSSTPSSGPS